MPVFFRILERKRFLQMDTESLYGISCKMYLKMIE